MEDEHEHDKQNGRVDDSGDAHPIDLFEFEHGVDNRRYNHAQTRIFVELKLSFMRKTEEDVPNAYFARKCKNKDHGNGGHESGRRGGGIIVGDVPAVRIEPESAQNEQQVHQKLAQREFPPGKRVLEKYRQARVPHAKESVAQPPKQRIFVPRIFVGFPGPQFLTLFPEQVRNELSMGFFCDLILSISKRTSVKFGNKANRI